MNGIILMIETFYDFGCLGLWLAIQAGFYAGLLAVVVLVVNVLFRRWLSPGQMGLLWGLVLLRLMIPVAPTSPLSLQNAFLTDANEAAEVAQAATYIPVDNSAVPVGELQSYGVSQPATAEVASPSWTPEVWFELCMAMLPFVWMIGVLAILMRTAVVHWRFCRSVKQTPQSSDERLLRLWDECCQRAGVRSKSSMALFDGVEQPAVMGLLHPTLLLPHDVAELDDGQLRMIMTHELAHVRRWDIAVNWALVVIRAIHWWNPIYWIAAARFRSLREQACDAFAIVRLENQSISGYSEMLLKLAQHQPAAPLWRVTMPASILGFFSSRFRNLAVRSRLKALRSAGIKRGRWHTAGVVGVILLLAFSGLTDANTREQETSTSRSQLRYPAVATNLNRSYESYEVFEDYQGPLVTRNYDIEDALNRATANTTKKDEAVKKMEQALAHLFRTTHPDGDKAIDPSSDAPQASYTIHGNTLTAKAPVALHDKLGSTLEAWEESGPCQSAVKFRYVRSEHDMASELKITWQYLEAFASNQTTEVFPTDRQESMPIVRATASVEDYLPIAVATLNDNQTTAFLDAAQGDSRTNVLELITVKLFNGQATTIADQTQRPFVVGVQEIGVGTHKPKVVVIEEGTRIKLCGLQSSDHKKMRLQANVSFSSVGEVSTTSSTLRDRLVTIQIPKVNRSDVEIAYDVEDGHTLLVGCIPTDSKQEFTYFLLTASNLREPADAD